MLKDMSISKIDAMDKCKALSEPFTEHFHKIYASKESQSIDFWCKELNHLYSLVCEIVLKNNKSKLTNEQKEDWFFTGWSLPEYIFTDKDEVKKYELFYNEVLNDIPIREAIKDVLNK